MCIGKRVNGRQNMCEAFNDDFPSVFSVEELLQDVPNTSSNLICLDDITVSKKKVLKKISVSISIEGKSPCFLKTDAPFLINHALINFSISINNARFQTYGIKVM